MKEKINLRMKGLNEGVEAKSPKEFEIAKSRNNAISRRRTLEPLQHLNDSCLYITQENKKLMPTIPVGSLSPK